MAQGFINQQINYTIQGAGAPAIIPQFVGQQYIDTTSGAIYISIGTSGVYNWGYVGQGAINAFTANTVTGLLHWYDANDLTTITKDSGGKVTVWNDKSGSLRHLVNTDGGTAQPPVWTSGYQNGLPSVVFNGTNQGIFSNSYSITSYPLTIFTVLKPTNWSTGATQQPICGYSGSADNMQLFKTASASTVSIFWYNTASSPGGSINNSTGSLVTAVYNGGSSSIQINNNAVSNVTIGTTSTVMYLMLGRSYATQNYYYAGGVCEILIYNGSLSTSQQSLVQTYLNNKWRIY